ncbi:translation initiation factor 3 [Tanacetum coccineum]
MARVTTNTTNCIVPSSKQSVSFSLLQSKFSCLRFQFTSLRVRITCRYGGGGNSRLEDSRKSQQQNSSNDDQALDVTTIRSNTVRLIDDQQNMVGIVSKSAAIQMAEDAELDLVILSPDADPPVVKLMDYGYNIDVHDYSVRLRAAQKFLKDGDKVKVIVNLKGRENEFRNNAIELLKRFRNDIGELMRDVSPQHWVDNWIQDVGGTKTICSEFLNLIRMWEISAMEQLPEYLKPLYKIILNEHTELEKQLSKNGRGNSVTASKQAVFQELARGYLQEAEWRHRGQVPSFQEYMKNGLITSTYNVLFKSSVMGMSEIVTQEALDWYLIHTFTCR